MPPRQVWIFQLGCWAAFAAALVHVAAHVMGAPSVESVAHLNAVPPPSVFIVPGLLQPSTAGVLSGLSLAFALLLATISAAGLGLVKRTTDEQLLRSVARAFALGSAGLLVLSIADFFSVQTFAIAVMALCFGIATVPQE